MLIIFDLDDTLIDTSGFVTPYQLRGALQELLQGSPLLFDPLYQELMQSNQEATTSKQALTRLAARYHFSPESLHRACDAMTRPLPHTFLIPLTLGAKKILSYLSSTDAFLALVTHGIPSFQMEKLEKSGIDPTIFSNMAIPEEGSKGPYYQALGEAFGVSPRETWVIGDRPMADLLPAYELGYRTLLRRWGRGVKEPKSPWMDGELFDLSEYIEYKEEAR